MDLSRSKKEFVRIRLYQVCWLLLFLRLYCSLESQDFIQWRANQQAKFLQEFGQEAARIEGIMRFAYLLPLHNIGQETNQVEERLAHLESRMKSFGDKASGPGNYALGRGYLALHRYEDANDHLKQAWDRFIIVNLMLHML